MKNVLWVGPLVNKEDLVLFRFVSPAANVWQNRFIELLENIDFSVTALSYVVDTLWPKGQMIPRYCKQLNGDNFRQSKHVSYLNIPYLRESSLTKNLIREAEKLLKKNRFDYVITYNPLIRHVKLAEHLRKKGLKWISIIADDESLGEPDLAIFLSYENCAKSPLKNKMCFEGIVPHFHENSIAQNPHGKKVILYSGAINKWTGIEEFARQFSELGADGVELHIYGKDNFNLIESIKSPSVIYKGFVSDAELAEAFRNAYCFVNPRPLNIEGGENNFPSKILEYISYGKPIISTKTSGIPPEYDEALYYYSTREQLKDLLTKVTLFDNASLKEINDRLKTLAGKKSVRALSQTIYERLR